MIKDPFSINAILGSSSTANECVDSRLRSKTPEVICKLDIEKVYDHVNWKFLLYLLRKVGFNEKWSKWIGKCISTALFSMMIYGSSFGYFRSSCRLQQGDPLSPFQFSIVIVAFNKLLKKAVEGNMIKGQRRKYFSFVVSDDSLVFCDASSSQLQYLQCVLHCFEVVSGLKINLGKTELVAVGDGVDMNSLATILECKVGTLSTTYLRLPLGAAHKSTSIWDLVVERFEKRLGRWQKGYLSKGGKITLIKSTLSSHPTYFISLSKIPIVV